MKKSFYLILFFTITNFVRGQGNLQFNKVVYIQADTSLNSCIFGSNCPDSFLVKTIVVDSGKILKIESINGTVNDGYYQFSFNSISIFNTASFSIFPIWLPAGTYKIKFQIAGSFSGTYSNRHYFLFSGIEFNIVP